jgi:hypothetical protein
MMGVDGLEGLVAVVAYSNVLVIGLLGKASIDAAQKVNACQLRPSHRDDHWCVNRKLRE